MLSNEQVADLLCDLADVGTTIDRFQGVIALMEGYVVGGEVKALTIDNSNPRWWKITMIERWLDKLPIGQRLVGSWVDGNTLYVDAVRIVKDEAVAINLAKQRGEVAIYDVRNQHSIYIKETA